MADKPTPPPLPDTIKQLLNAVYQFAKTDDLGVISALSKGTGTSRFVLAGQVVQRDGSVLTVPLGYLSTGIADDVDNPAEVSPIVTVTPDPAAPATVMDDFTATMIAEGVQEADPDTVLRAWQHLEDTGLGYRLQGWFGRRLRDLIAEGSITPRKEAA